jgi:broad specificity phosphatase PhoE
LVRVILVRHGETDWNQSGRLLGGNSDIELNEKGRQQAKRLATRLKQERIQAIYSSPLHRALDTAQAIARHHQLQVESEPALKEMDVGKLDGTPIRQIGIPYDQLLTRESEERSVFKMHGGESLAEVQQRAWGVIQRLISQHPDGVIVVVSHFFVILSVICSMLNLPLSQMSRFRLGIGSISTIIFDGQTPRLELFNDICHLTTD